MEIRLLTSGGPEIERRLGEITSRVVQAADKAAKRAGDLVVGAAKKNILTERGAPIGSKTTKRGNAIAQYAAFGLPVDGQLTSRSGTLRGSIAVYPQGGGRVKVGTPVVYAAIHEFGGAMANGGTMPQRPYLIPALETKHDEAEKTIAAVLRQELNLHD